MNARAVTPARTKFAELRAWGNVLAQRLDAAALRLMDDGVPPDESLLVDMRRLHGAVDTFARQYDLTEEGFAADNWETLESALTWREYRTELTPLLADVRRIRHTSGQEFEPLAAAQLKASQLLQSLAERSGSEAEFKALISGEHGLAALMQLATQSDSLGDAEWERHQQLVSDDLNRALAVAAARGQLRIERAAPPAPRDDDEGSSLASLPLSLSELEPPRAIASALSPSPPPPPPAAVPVAAPPSLPEAGPQLEITRDDPAEIRTASLVSDVAFDDALTAADSVLDDWPAEGSERRRLARLDLPDLASLPAHDVSPTAVPHVIEHDVAPAARMDASVLDEDAPRSDAAATSLLELELSQEARSIAQRALRSGGLTRERAVSDLLWRLIYDGFSGMAWQLGRASESVYGRPGCPAAQSLRLWALGSRVESPFSESAAAVAECGPLLTELSSGTLAPLAEAETILRAAGLLRAAVIAPDTGAGEQLLACALRLEQPRMVEYAETILQVGDELQKAGSLDRTGSGLARSPAGRLRDVQRRAQEWLESAQGGRPEIHSTEPLFAEPHWTLRIRGLQQNPTLAPLVAGWLHALRMAHALLQPVVQHNTQARPDVRALANRVQSKLLTGARNDYPTGIDAIIVPDESIADYLRHAAELAEEWVELGGSQPPAAAEDDPWASDSLLATLASRQAALLSTLQQRVLECEDAPRQTAVGCLMLIVDQVAELVSSFRPVVSPQPTESMILSEHLVALGFPDIGSTGLPACSDTELLPRLLQAIAAGAPAPAGQPAPLADGPKASRSTASNVLLEDRPEPWERGAEPFARTPSFSLSDELQSLEAVLNRAVAAGRLSPHDHAGFASRLSALRGESLDPLNELVQRNELILLRKRLELRGISAGGTTGPGTGSAPREKTPLDSDDVASSVLLDD